MKGCFVFYQLHIAQQCINEETSLRTQPMWDSALLYPHLRYHKPKGFSSFLVLVVWTQSCTRGAWAKLLSHLSEREPLAGDRLHSPDSQSCYRSLFWVRRAGWQSEPGWTKACPVQNIGTGIVERLPWLTRWWWRWREGDACCHPTVLSGLWAVWLYLGFILPEAR